MISQIKEQVTTQQMLFLAFAAGLSFVITGFILLGNSYHDRFLANTYINSTNVSGLKLSEGMSLLEKNKSSLEPHEFVLSIDDISLASSSAELGYTTDFSKAANDVFVNQHKNNKFVNSLNAVIAYIKKTEVNAPKKYDYTKLQQFLSAFNKRVELIGNNPSVELKVSNSPSSIIVSPGIPGRELDKQNTSSEILSAIQNNDFIVTAKIASTSSVLNEEEIAKTIDRASTFVGKDLLIKAEDKKFYLNDKELVSYINPLGGFFEDNISSDLGEWAEEINSEPQNAVFKYDKDSLQVSEFVPNRDGLEVDIKASKDRVVEFLNYLEDKSKMLKTKSDDIDSENSNSISLTLNKTKPEITLEQTNDLGINERIGFGESYYYHSIPNRIHNVDITNKKVNLTIVPPGEEFSFNKTLGDVSKATGYRSAYVIQGGKTVLGDGGGVCQVSSTTFRAVLDAGLDITKRLQHAYRVSYYELSSDPGFDATVYSGDIDFRFVNDTTNHIILLYQNYPEKLYMNVEIYGTNDGRVSKISNYKKWGQVGAPEPEYFPTTELPTGVIKQVDWAVSGIKTEFTHTVTNKDGDIIHNDTYYSNYRPWSAKYMVGI